MTLRPDSVQALDFPSPDQRLAGGPEIAVELQDGIRKVGEVLVTRRAISVCMVLALLAVSALGQSGEDTPLFYSVFAAKMAVRLDASTLKVKDPIELRLETDICEANDCESHPKLVPKGAKLFGFVTSVSSGEASESQLSVIVTEARWKGRSQNLNAFVSAALKWQVGPGSAKTIERSPPERVYVPGPTANSGRWSTRAGSGSVVTTAGQRSLEVVALPDIEVRPDPVFESVFVSTRRGRHVVLKKGTILQFQHLGLKQQYLKQQSPKQAYLDLDQSVIRLQYPAGWEVSSNGPLAVRILPPEGTATGEVTYGVIINAYQPPQAQTLEQYTAEVLQSLAQLRPQMHRVGEISPLTLDGGPAHAVQLEGPSPLSAADDQIKERNLLVVTQHPDGKVIWLLFIAPESHFTRMEPVFEHMLNSARF